VTLAADVQMVTTRVHALSQPASSEAHSGATVQQQDEGRPPAAGQGYLSGNFAPVGGEVFAGDLPVEGTLPAALDGVYIRNGPNPQFPPDAPAKHHWCAPAPQSPSLFNNKKPLQQPARQPNVPSCAVSGLNGRGLAHACKMRPSS